MSESSNKNKKMIASFAQYCCSHPEQRFFQALRNWTRENIDADCNYIFIGPDYFGEDDMTDEMSINSLKDTFYYEDDKIN